MKKDSTRNATANCCDGKFVKVAGDTLTVTCDEGDEQQYTVAKDAKVTCEGKASKLADLNKGATIRMTLCNDDEDRVIAVDCEKRMPDLASS